MTDPQRFDDLEEDIEQEGDSGALIAAGIFIFAAGRWLNRNTGQAVPDLTVTNEMRLHTASTFDPLTSLTLSLFSGAINIQQWQVASAAVLKDVHLAQAMYGAGGRANMGAAGFARVRNTLQAEYGFLSQFADEIAAGNISEAQALARIRQFGKATQQSYWNEFAAQSTGLIDWFLHPAEHCEATPGFFGCVDLAAGSPYTAETLPTTPGAGGTTCRGNCNCTLGRR